MSGAKVNLANISDKVDETLAASGLRKSGKNFKFFLSKNNRVTPNEQDKQAVTAYSAILFSKVSNLGNTVTKFFQGNRRPPTTSLGKTNSVPLTSNSRFSNTSNKTNLKRCSKCNCCMQISNPKCAYCPDCKEDDIEIIDKIDSDCEEFPSIEHCTRDPPRNPRMTNLAIPTSSFYSSKENSSFTNKSTPKPNVSRSNITFTEDEDDENIRYDIDFLFIGTHRIVDRSNFRLGGDSFSLRIITSKDCINISYKLIKNVVMCEAKSEQTKSVYIQINFTREAVDEINKFLKNINMDAGIFKYDSINGHEKYFLMKVRYLHPDEALKLKKRLKIHFPNRCEENRIAFKLLEEQRTYTLTRAGHNNSAKRQKTDNNRGSAHIQEKSNLNEIKKDIRSQLRDEPMEIGRVPQSMSTMTTRSRNYERTPFSGRMKLSYASSNAVNVIDQDEDPEIREISKPKYSLPIKSIKNNKILFKTATGESQIILKTDLSCLNDGNFLNDKIIEFYLMYIKANLIDSAVAEKTYIFSSFFFTKMLSLTKGPLSDAQFYENLYNLVKTWTKSVDIFGYDYLIVPIFRNYHWSLAIVCYPGKVFKDDFEIMLDGEEEEKPAILFMDSMGKNRISHKYARYLRNFMEKECFNKKALSESFQNQAMTMLEPEVPCQLNGYDCGIFVLHYVELFLKNPKSVIRKIRQNKASLNTWFESNSLNGKRKEIFKILFQIYEENLQNNLKFESEDDLTLNKSDEEIEIITNDDSNNKALFSDDEDTMEIS